MITKVLALAIFLVLTTALPAAAISEWEQWKSKVGRVAAAPEGYARVLCVCTNGGVYDNAAGELRWVSTTLDDDDFLTIYCQVKIFDSGGELTRNAMCTEFIPLPR